MTSRGTKYWNSGAIPLIAPEILGNIISEVSDIGVVIDESGLVLSILTNPNNTGFDGLAHFEGQNMRSVLTVESVPKFEERLAAFLNGDDDIRPVELNHQIERQRLELPVRYSFHRIGPDGAVLLLGRDLRPVAEMQQQLVNAQLAIERDYEAQRNFETRFRVLMDNASEAIVFVALQSGRISEANDAAATLMRMDANRMAGTAFNSLFAEDSSDELVADLATLALSDQIVPRTVKLRDRDVSATITPTLFRAGGERLLMCQIAFSDGSTITDPLTENLRSLYLKGTDGIVFTSETGQILSANDGFQSIVGSPHDASLRGRALPDFMQRGSVDFKVMTDNALRVGRMRMYGTKIAGDYGSPRNVEIAVTTINAEDTTIFAFVIRETNRIEPARATDTDSSMQSVVELVGSATLKEIVAETTNVVEKMCIETAVELTSNNRVATAEMLGLSRQSLYVKLRKFGIMDRDSNG